MYVFLPYTRSYSSASRRIFSVVLNAYALNKPVICFQIYVFAQNVSCYALEIYIKYFDFHLALFVKLSMSMNPRLIWYFLISSQFLITCVDCILLSSLHKETQLVSSSHRTYPDRFTWNYLYIPFQQTLLRDRIHPSSLSVKVTPTKSGLWFAPLSLLTLKGSQFRGLIPWC